jgi:tRNA dimethylallyltransferase
MKIGQPLTVFIVGTAAMGKTRLSLELSKYFDGEVVRCDSKQIYNYANIMTGKPTK